MDLNTIKSLLPDPNSEAFEKAKIEHPYSILTKYGTAIAERYENKLAGIVTESTDAISEELISYAFYIYAAIANGYNYRLLELEPLSGGSIYPLKIRIFQDHPQDLKEVQNHFELEQTMQNVLKMGFTQTLLLNLLAQVKLYEESRSEDV